MICVQDQHPDEQSSPICEHVSNTERMKSEETPNPEEALQESRERNLDKPKESRSQQRKKMMKKTKSGQPLMKYRVEKILSQI